MQEPQTMLRPGRDGFQTLLELFDPPNPYLAQPVSLFDGRTPHIVHLLWDIYQIDTLAETLHVEVSHVLEFLPPESCPSKKGLQQCIWFSAQNAGWIYLLPRSRASA